MKGGISHRNVFMAITPNASKATKIIQIGFELNKICSYEVKGVIVWFKLIKPICNLKHKIFGPCYVVVELP